MKIIGFLMIVGVLFWLFIVTMPFLWWLWILILGVVIYLIGIHRKEIREEKQKEKEFEKMVENFEDGAPINIKDLGR